MSSNLPRLNLGKTLLVDTLQELFEGSEELFRGLAVHGKRDWSARYPVVRISFGGRNFIVPDRLHRNAMMQLDAAEKRAGVQCGYPDASDRLHHLRTARARRAARGRAGGRTSRSALGDRELARANRGFLRDLYGVIKDCDEHLRFVFLTGVSELAGLFSGLNNLLEPEFSDICGCTDAELDAVFAPELEDLDRDEIRRWYNGYNWRGPERI